ncbi:hypothetical protein AB3S75_034549 [Citrus x aurantiifolia]
MSEPYEKIGTNDNSSFFGVFPPPFVDDRSSKKARWRANGMDANNPLPASYRDALRDSGLGKNSIHGMTEGEEFHDDDWDFEPGDVMVSSDGAMPTIDFSKRIQEKLIKPWQNSVVVKLLGKNIGYRVLCNRLKSMWKKIGEFSVVDLENNFFLIRLQSYEDVEYVVTEGPWVIMGHYLTVQPWSPQFDSKVTKLDTVNAWIRLPGMPMHLYDKRILKKVGQLVGFVLKIDVNTASNERGKFARLAVRISLNKPLVSQFKINGSVQKVEYEGLPVICFKCGRYGHPSNGCTDGAAKEDALEAPVGTEVAFIPHTTIHTNAGKEDPNREGSFGPWMIAPRRRRAVPIIGKENVNSSMQNQNHNAGLSRFNVLADDSDNVEAVGVTLHESPKELPQLPNPSIYSRTTSKPKHVFNPIANPKAQTLRPNMKGKQIAKPQPPKPKQTTIETSKAMHASGISRPKATPSSKQAIPPSATSLGPSIAHTTLNPKYHKVISFAYPPNTLVGETSGAQMEKAHEVNPGHQPPLEHLNDPPDNGEVGAEDDIMNSVDDTTFDVDNSFVNETPGLQETLPSGTRQ